MSVETKCEHIVRCCVLSYSITSYGVVFWCCVLVLTLLKTLSLCYIVYEVFESLYIGSGHIVILYLYVSCFGVSEYINIYPARSIRVTEYITIYPVRSILGVIHSFRSIDRYLSDPNRGSQSWMTLPIQ